MHKGLAMVCKDHDSWRFLKYFLEEEYSGNMFGCPREAVRVKVKVCMVNCRSLPLLSDSILMN